jgi:serine/threonine-protein kinase
MIIGASPSARTDLFALGVVLWESLAQRRLFNGKSAREILLAVKNSEVERLTTHRGDVPEELAEVIHKALSKKAEDRYGSATEMARALASLLRKHPEPTDAEPLGRAVREARSRMGMSPRGGSMPSPF